MHIFKVFLLIALPLPTFIFSKQAFHGDLRGTADKITVVKVGEQPANNIAQGVKLANNSTSDNTPNSLVKRDSTGNFMANQIKLLGSPTDDTHIVTKTYLDSAINNNLDLINTIGGVPNIIKTYYVSKAGNDTNSGSFANPFLTIKAAIAQASLVASANNIVVIQVGTGIFIEDNSISPIMINTNGINIVGESTNGTIIQPLNLTYDLFYVTVPVIEFVNLTLDAGADGSTGSAINLTTNNSGINRFESLFIQRFNIGISLNSNAGIPIASLNNTQFRGNNISISANNIRALIRNSAYLGPFSGSAPSNTGISVTGTTSLVTIISNSFRLMDTGVAAATGSSLRIVGSNFENSIYGITCNSASTSTIVGCNFLINHTNTTNCLISDTGTTVTITGCNFSCNSSSVEQGTAVAVTTGASAHISSCLIEKAVIGLLCGTPSDTINTILIANAVSLSNNINDVTQLGLSTVRFIAGIADHTKLNIANSTNVSFNSFDDILTIGNNSDNNQVLFQILNGQINLPNIIYNPNYYGNKGLIYQNDNSDAIVSGVQTQGNHVYNYLVTGDNTKETGIHLISDTTPFGNNNNVRGWAIVKTGTNADLTMSYRNDDTASQALRGENIVMKLNGLDNQVEFPATINAPFPTNSTAKLIWADDTNLYRQNAGVLKTDGNLVANNITANKLTLLNISCNQATQLATPTNGGMITVNANTAILILKNTNNITGCTINFPANPTDGQFFMILLGTSNNVTGITNSTTDGANIVNGVTSLTPTDLIITDGGASVSYFYLLATNTWYRCQRG